jgi:hypothetical protein
MGLKFYYEFTGHPVNPLAISVWFTFGTIIVFCLCKSFDVSLWPPLTYVTCYNFFVDKDLGWFLLDRIFNI